MFTPVTLLGDIGNQLSSLIFSAQFVQLIITLLLAFLIPVLSAMVINYLERKIMAWIQDRAGLLHTGPHGSMQLVADVGKMLLKEDVRAAKTDKYVFLLAPSTFIAPMIASFAVLLLLVSMLLATVPSGYLQVVLPLYLNRAGLEPSLPTAGPLRSMPRRPAPCIA